MVGVILHIARPVQVLQLRSLGPRERDGASRDTHRGSIILPPAEPC